MSGLIVKTMLGMGDNLWSRPHILALARLYSPLVLITPWPQCYVDIARKHDVLFARPHTRLRTQTENVCRLHDFNWIDLDQATRDDQVPVSQDGMPAFRLAYRPAAIATGANHHDSLEASARNYLGDAGVSPLDIAMEIPDEWQERADALIRQWTGDSGKPAVIVRPPTVRREWENPARNCDPRALQQLINTLRLEHTLIGIAHLVDEVEWLTDPGPRGLDFEYYRGELPIEVLLGLTRRCWTIGANGFMVPMAIAMGGYAYVLFGGNYGYNAPDRLLHPGYDLSKLGYSEPDHPCTGCIKPTHTCRKSIDSRRLLVEFGEWRARQNKSEKEMGGKLTTRAFDEQYYAEHVREGLDYLSFGDWQKQYAAWLADVFGWKGKHILDVGCACGAILRGFLSAGTGTSGVDVNEHMIQLGRKRWPDLRLYTCDAVNLHLFADGEIEGIHSAQVAEHWKPELVPFILRECRRVLREGGLFFCCMDTAELYEREGRDVATEDPTHYCVQPMRWWLEQFAEAGFEDVTADLRGRLLAHPRSMLAGSTSESRAKYDWEFVVMRAK